MAEFDERSYLLYLYERGDYSESVVRFIASIFEERFGHDIEDERDA